MNMSKSRDILAKMPSPKVIFYAFWLVTVKVLNSFDEIIYVFLTIFLYLLKCPQSLIL